MARRSRAGDAGDPPARRRRGAVRRDRGRGAVPGCARRGVAGRRAGGVHRAGVCAARVARGSVRANARPVSRTRRGRNAWTRPRDASRARSPRSRRRDASSAASSDRAASNANGATRTCCACSAAGPWRRSGARSSRSTRAALGRFLPEWQAVTRPRSGPSALLETIGQLQGAAIPASILETDVLPSRVRGYRPADLDALCASGDVVWIGAGGIGADDGRIALGFRDHLRFVAAPPAEQAPSGPLHDALREHLEARGASFWPELYAAAGGPGRARGPGCALGPRLGRRGDQRHAGAAPRVPPPHDGRGLGGPKPRPGVLRQAGPPAGAGRWSLADIAAQARADADRDRSRPGHAAARTPRGRDA